MCGGCMCEAILSIFFSSTATVVTVLKSSGPHDGDISISISTAGTSALSNFHGQ